MATIAKKRKNLMMGLAFLAPNLIGFMCLTFLPLVISLAMAFTNWDLTLHNIFKTNPIRFVGLDNFKVLFSDQYFWQYFGNTLFLMIGIPFGIAGSLSLALLLNKNFKGPNNRVYCSLIAAAIVAAGTAALLAIGMGATAMTSLFVLLAGVLLIGGAAGGSVVYRTMFYLPSFTAGTAVFVLWQKLYNPNTGPVNTALKGSLESLANFVQGTPSGVTTFLCWIILIIAVVVQIVSFVRLQRLWNSQKLDKQSVWISSILIFIPAVLAAIFISGLGRMVLLLSGGVMFFIQNYQMADCANPLQSRQNMGRGVLLGLLSMVGQLCLIGFGIGTVLIRPDLFIFGLGWVFLLLAAWILFSILTRLRKLWKDGEVGRTAMVIPLIFSFLPAFLSFLWIDGPGRFLLPFAAVVFSLWQLAQMKGGRDFFCQPGEGFGGAAMMGLLSLTGQLLFVGLGMTVFSLPVMASDGLTPPNWLGDIHWAKPALMIMGFWIGVGSRNMLLYLAGLSNIPPELYEAADIDGAKPLQRFWNITWPQLAPTTFFIVVMSVIGGLQGGFEQARVMTGGGPDGATTTLSYYIYKEGFEIGQLGFASAAAWALFVFMFSVTLFNWRFGNRYVND